MIKDFVLTTREIDALLGAEGKQGIVQRLLGDESRVRTLRQAVAAACEERADLPAAVKLYHEVCGCVHCFCRKGRATDLTLHRLASTLRLCPCSTGP